MKKHAHPSDHEWRNKTGPFSQSLQHRERNQKFYQTDSVVNLAVSHYFATAYLKEFPHDIIGFKWNKEAMVNI